jgi:hypothetical protein
VATRGLTDSTQRVSFYDDAINPSHQNNLWRDCPLLEYQHDPSIGIYLNETWGSYNAQATTGDYILTQATAGSAAMSTTISGALAINAGSATSTQGANVQRAKSAFVPAAGKDLWFETTIQTTFPTFLEVFVGLAELDTTIIATSAISTANHIGWYSVTDDGVLLFGANKASAAATKAAATLASATNIKLGFKVNGITSIDQYINGVLTGTAHVTANVPIVALYPSFVVQSAGTSQPVLSNLGYRVFQLR